MGAVAGDLTTAVPGPGHVPVDDVLWIVNPIAGTGRKRDRTAEIRAELPDARIHQTQRAGEATEVARQAVRAGVREIVAVGGDGTLAEVARGVLEQDATGATIVGFVPAGTCNDFARGRDVSPNFSGLLDAGRAIRMDVGQVTCTASDERATRHFVVNGTVGLVSAIGESFTVKRPLNMLLKRVSVTLAEVVYGIGALLRWRPVRLRLDLGSQVVETPATNLAVLKVPFFAGGLAFGSDVALDDGSFDVVVIGGLGKAGIARLIWSAFRGRLGNHPARRSWRTENVVVESHTPLPVEVDGEIAGRTPARFTLLPRRLLTIT